MPQTVAERLAATTNFDGPVKPGMTQCWVTTLAPASPRGLIKIAGKSVIVPRAAWVEANGPIPDGLFVCHHCDTPRCIRLSHMFLGTAGENSADMVGKMRHRNQVKDRCPAEHDYAGRNLYVDKLGNRHCRKCRAAAAARFRARQVA